MMFTQAYVENRTKNYGQASSIVYSCSIEFHFKSKANRGPIPLPTLPLMKSQNRLLNKYQTETATILHSFNLTNKCIHTDFHGWHEIYKQRPTSPTIFTVCFWSLASILYLYTYSLHFFLPFWPPRQWLYNYVRISIYNNRDHLSLICMTILYGSIPCCWIYDNIHGFVCFFF